VVGCEHGLGTHMAAKGVCEWVARGLGCIAARPSHPPFTTSTALPTALPTAWPTALLTAAPTAAQGDWAAAVEELRLAESALSLLPPPLMDATDNLPLLLIDLVW
jgi:hypothetical protein